MLKSLKRMSIILILVLFVGLGLYGIIVSVCTKGDIGEEDLSPQLPFEDISRLDKAYAAVYYCYYYGLMDGVTQTMFAPDEPMSRTIAVMALWKLAGAPVCEPDGTFTDVDVSAPYGQAVYWAYYDGLIYGVEENVFGPDQPITAGQFAAMLNCFTADGTGRDGQSALDEADDAAVLTRGDGAKLLFQSQEPYGLAAVQIWCKDALTITNAQGQHLDLEQENKPSGNILVYHATRSQEGNSCYYYLTLAGSEVYTFDFTGGRGEVFLQCGTAYCGISGNHLEEVCLYADNRVTMTGGGIWGTKYQVHFEHMEYDSILLEGRCKGPAEISADETVIHINTDCKKWRAVAYSVNNMQWYKETLAVSDLQTTVEYLPNADADGNHFVVR